MAIGAASGSADSSTRPASGIPDSGLGSGASSDAATITRISRSFGLYIHPLDVTILAKGASFARGDVVQFDWAMSVATTYTDNLSTSIKCIAVTPTAAGIRGEYPCGVCLHTIAANAVGMIRVRGPALASVEKATGAANIAQGDRLVVTTSRTFDADPAVTEAYRAIALFSRTAAVPSAAALSMVFVLGDINFGERAV